MPGREITDTAAGQLVHHHTYGYTPAACARTRAAFHGPSRAGSQQARPATHRAAASRPAPAKSGTVWLGQMPGLVITGVARATATGNAAQQLAARHLPAAQRQVVTAHRVGHGDEVGGHLHSAQQRCELGRQLVAQALTCTEGGRQELGWARGSANHQEAAKRMLNTRCLQATTHEVRPRHAAHLHPNPPGSCRSQRPAGSRLHCSA